MKEPPLDPAVTQWSTNGAADRGAPLVPPFVPGQTAEPAPASNAAEPAPPPQPRVAQPDPDRTAMPWDAEQDDGVVEPVFEEDVAVTTQEILASSEAEGDADFNVDAFIIPDDVRRIPTGLDPTQVDALRHHEHDRHEKPDPAHELADRFEKLSRRLRNEELDTILPSLTRGDRFDSLLAGFLAGYFSAHDA